MAKSAGIGALIAQYKEQHTLIGIHCADQKHDRFFGGYIEEIDGKKFRLRYVNVGGQPGKNGEEVAWFYEREIDWIEHDTPYMKALAKLEAAHERFAGLRDVRWRRTHRGIVEALRSSVESGGVCRLRFGETNDVRALVDELGRDFACLTLLKEDGTYFGKKVVRIKCITAIRSSGMQIACLNYLAHSQHPDTELK